MINAPVMVLNTNTKREIGRTAQLGTIQAASSISSIVRTTLGPLSMLKMLLDPMGGIVLTNDGNAILREIDVSHPAGKSIIELSRAQEEEVGDGTTSVIILTGEILTLAEPLLLRQYHPTTIIQGYYRALHECLTYMKMIAQPVNLKDAKVMEQLITSSIGSKFMTKVNHLLSQLAIKAVLLITKNLATVSMIPSSVANPLHSTKVSEANGGEKSTTTKDGQNESIDKDIDIKRYAKIEKIPGGNLEDSCVLDGIMLNKDITHSQMRRSIQNPRILLLDCPLEYKKSESQINVEITNEEDWNVLLRLEEEYIENLCAQIVAMKPDIVITEKGVSDLAQHYFVKANITALRRVRKTDNNRLARACGATIVSRPDEIQESDVGTLCGEFKVEKIGDEYFSFFTKCVNPKACTIILRGGTKDVLNEMERDLQDAMQNVRNLVIEPCIVPGGGAIEMACSAMLKARVFEGMDQAPYLRISEALEVIPRTLLQNCGADVIHVMTALRAKHVWPTTVKEEKEKRMKIEWNQLASELQEQICWGVDGFHGKLRNMYTDKEKKDIIWEPLSVKIQTLKTAIEASGMLLRIDDIVSGLNAKKKDGQ